MKYNVINSIHCAVQLIFLFFLNVSFNMKPYIMIVNENPISLAAN